MPYVRLLYHSGGRRLKICCRIAPAGNLRYSQHGRGVVGGGYTPGCLHPRGSILGQVGLFGVGNG